MSRASVAIGLPRALLVALVVLLGVAQAGCRAQHASGPARSVTQALAIDPETRTLYAGGAGGVYTSADGGVHWTRTSLRRRVDALALDPRTGTVFAAGSTVSRTSDGGKTWHGASTGLCSDCDLTSLAIDPNAADTVYAGNFGTGGVFESTNGGDSWRLHEGAPAWVQALVVDTKRPGDMYAGTDGGIFRTAGAGETWKRARGMRENLVSALAIDPREPRRLYAGTRVTDVFRSVDGGVTWSSVQLGFREITALTVDPTSPNRLYAGTFDWTGGDESDGRVFRSSDHGASWTPAASGFGDARVNALAIDLAAPRTVYAATDAGMFRSEDRGRTWSRPGEAPAPAPQPTTEPQVSGGVPGSSPGYVYALAADPARSNAAYAGTVNGVFRTTNGGRSWNASGLAGEAIMGGLAIAPGAPDTVYAVLPFGELRRTTNGGDTWTETGLHGQEVTAVAIDPRRATTVYAGTFGGVPAAFPGELSGVFETSNGGASWRVLGGRLPGVQALAIDPREPGRLYAGTRAGVFSSENRGGSWRRLGTGMCRRPRSCPSVLALAIDPHAPRVLYAGTENGAFKTVDGGRAWRALDRRVTGWRIGAVVIDPRRSETVYLGSSGAGGPTGVLRSDDGGRTWRSLDARLARQGVSALAIDRTGSIVYAELGEGVLAVRVRK